jgi:3',5'-cyclic AMP phosphodiesterase CpdA
MRGPVLVQLSDPHLGAEWGGRDPAAALAAAVESVRQLRDAPDAVVVSGDLAEHGADAEYELVRALLEPLGASVHVLAGNHDDRAALRRAFDLPGEGDEPVQYATDVGQLRLVALDTTLPGGDGGALEAGRLAWLDAALSAAPDRPTLVAMHHPPIATGLPAFDAIGLPEADRRGLAGVVRRHPHVCGLVAGHVHRTIVGELGGRAVLVAPSTYAQAGLDLGSARIEFGDDPPGLAVHVLAGGGLVSHVQPIG